MSEYKHITEEQKKFIRDNRDTMSNKGLSKKLGISRNAIQKYSAYLDLTPKEKTVKTEPAAEKSVYTETKLPKLNKTIRKSLEFSLFLLILLLAVFLRRHTFDLPHYRGDQHHYIGLAFKLGTEGVSGYNLRGIDMYRHKDHPELVIVRTASDKGHILKGLAQSGITYYDQPLHHMPFGFPLALMISHNLFAPGEPYHMLAINDTKIIQEAPPGVGLRGLKFSPAVAGKQYYSAIVPLFFSILMISCVYFISKLLFDNDWAALSAMFLMAISPIDILTSQKIWADDMTVGLAALGALLYLLALKKERSVLALAGGMACGLSVITKQNGVIIPIAIVCWHFANNWRALIKKETCLKVLLDKNLIFFGLGCVVSSGYWFYKVTLIYGNPLYKPLQTNLLEASKTAWFKMVHSRPKHLYLLGIPYQNPLFVLAYIAPIWLWIDKVKQNKLLFPTLWLVVSFVVAYKLMGGEHRYMLPAYPAFAILGAYSANRLRVILDRSLGLHSGSILLVIALLTSAIWSVPIAMNVLFHNGALILKPF